MDDRPFDSATSLHSLLANGHNTGHSGETWGALAWGDILDMETDIWSHLSLGQMKAFSICSAQPWRQ